MRFLCDVVLEAACRTAALAYILGLVVADAAMTAFDDVTDPV